MRFVLTAFLVVTGGCFLYAMAKALFKVIVEAFGEPKKNHKTNNHAKRKTNKISKKGNK